MVVSREIAAARLRRLEQCIQRLGHLRRRSREEYLANADAQTLAERLFQIATQCLLDIGNHVIAEEGLGTPEDAEGILDCLQRSGAIPADLHARTRGLAGFRNILVHDYLGIDHRIVYDLLGRLEDLIELGKALATFVEKRAESG